LANARRKLKKLDKKSVTYCLKLKYLDLQCNYQALQFITYIDTEAVCYNETHSFTNILILPWRGRRASSWSCRGQPVS
jgi:hypothetical protein